MGVTECAGEHDQLARSDAHALPHIRMNLVHSSWLWNVGNINQITARLDWFGPFLITKTGTPP